MKRIIAVVIAALMLAGCFAIPAGAETDGAKSYIDYDDANVVGACYEIVYWNGAPYNGFEAGTLPREAIDGLLVDGTLDDGGGSGKSTGMSGWIGFDREITAFGYMINGQITFGDFFEDTEAELKDASKGGEYARRYKVIIPLTGLYDTNELGVVAQLSDGTVVALNSTKDHQQDTFFKIRGVASYNQGDGQVVTVSDQFYPDGYHGQSAGRDRGRRYRGGRDRHKLSDRL